MIRRALLVAGVLLALLAVLAPPAWADSDHGRGHKRPKARNGGVVWAVSQDGVVWAVNQGGVLWPLGRGDLPWPLDRGDLPWPLGQGGVLWPLSANGFAPHLAIAPHLASGRASAGASDPAVTVSGPGFDTRQATVCGLGAAGWAPPPAGSSWISSAAACGAGQATGEYRYTIKFTLPSLDTLSNLRLAGSMLADDSARIELNGQSIFNGGRWDSPATFETTDRGRFRSGENALVFVVNNAGGATGLAFAADVTANGAFGAGSPVPRFDDDCAEYDD